MYKHGIYAEQIPFAGNIPRNALGTIPVYIGTAPIHQAVAASEYSGFVNKPILITGLADSKRKIGYSTDWNKFSLGEAISAHFENGVTDIGPIVVVNMADPKVLETDETTVFVTLSGPSGNKIGYLQDSAAAIENITISTADDDLSNADYSLSYENGQIKVLVNKTDFSRGMVTATYKRVDTSDAVISESVFETALNSLDFCEIICGVIPNIIAAPGYSQKINYHAKMISKALARLNEKWYTICVSDLPTDEVKTVAQAVAWKSEYYYNSKVDKICFPMVKFNGKKYHLSTMAAVDMQNIDTDAEGVPYISPSNKTIFADGAVLSDGSDLFITEASANQLNQEGISTVNYINGALRLWGGSMANYSFKNKDEINPEERQDASIRMMQYLLNTLQKDFVDNIDKPFARRDVDSLKASIQQWLNSLVSSGKLLYGAVEFNAGENTPADMTEGDFTFEISVTTTPNAKSITFKLQYTLEGLNSLTDEEE